MLVRSMSDEMAKCESAWRSFEMLAGPNVHGLKGAQKPSHDAYVRFLHHLYEFYLSAICRDAQDTDWDKRGPSKKPHEAHDQRIASEALRCVNSKIHSIEHDYAPKWENQITYYKGLLPLVCDAKGQLITDFGKAFREVRNHHAGHATVKRPKVSAIAFYRKYHALVYLLFQNTWSWRNARSTVGYDFDLSLPAKPLAHSPIGTNGGHRKREGSPP